MENRTPRRRALAQGNLVMTSGSQTAVFNPSTRTDSFPQGGGISQFSADGDTPLRGDTSPRPSTPPLRKREVIRMLDLSDEDVQQSTDAGVLVSDALAQRLGSDVTEVEICETVEKTPVKIICHSKQAIQSLLRNSGDIGQAARIDVDHLASVAVHGNTTPKYTKPDQATSARGAPQILVERNLSDEEKPKPNIAGGALDDTSICEVVEHFSPPHLTKPITPSGKAKKPISFPKDLELDTSTESTKENSNPTELTIEQLTKVEPVQAAQPIKKKKQGRAVASKFMQKAASIAVNRSQSQSQHDAYNSMLQKSRMKTQTRAESIKARNISMAASAMQKSTNRSTPSKMSKAVKKTGTPVAQSKPKRQASTPENMSMISHESFNVSAVNSTRTINRILNESESFIAVNQNNNAKERAAESKRVGTQSKKTPVEENVTQNTLDIHYARYIQWCFMSSKAQKAMDNEEQEVMNQLHGLWEENRLMKQKLSMIDQEHDRLEHVTNLDEMLDLQKSCLAPIVSELPLLQQYYQSMALALDTTRHELVTRGVYIPDTAKELSEYEASMMAALKESEQLLGELGLHTRQKSASTSQYAQAIETLEKVISDESEELARCKQLMKASHTLSNQENSMRIQEIEFSRL